MTDVAAVPAVVTTHEALDDAVESLRVRGRSVAVVMTMGGLHEGHAQLMRVARESADSVVVTVFVNPLQFGPNEDLDRYPRTLATDVELCAHEGVAVVYAPERSTVFEDEPLVTVSAGPLGGRLCGRSRPGHFDGVLTIVAKLLHLVGPDVAVFGQKDAQQLALIRRMVADLDFPVEVVAVPTVREPDGLALSSRNAYLTKAQRTAALALSRALAAGERAADEGPAAVVAAASAVIEAAGDEVRLDYLELVDPARLEPLTGAGPGLLAVAAWVGTTRLIDNVEMIVGGHAGQARTHQEP